MLKQESPRQTRIDRHPATIVSTTATATDLCLSIRDGNSGIRSSPKKNYWGSFFLCLQDPAGSPGKTHTPPFPWMELCGPRRCTSSLQSILCDSSLSILLFPMPLSLGKTYTHNQSDRACTYNDMCAARYHIEFFFFFTLKSANMLY